MITLTIVDKPNSFYGIKIQLFRVREFFLGF